MRFCHPFTLTANSRDVEQALARHQRFGAKAGVQSDQPQFTVFFSRAIFFQKIARPTFGQGEISIDLLKVVIHEVGHWIGLPHLAGNNVMAANLSQLDCINDEVINKRLAVTPAEHGTQTFALRQK